MVYGLCFEELFEDFTLGEHESHEVGIVIDLKVFLFAHQLYYVRRAII